VPTPRPSGSSLKWCDGVIRCRRALAGRREVALDVTERAHGEGQRDQGDQSPDDPGDQRDAAGALDTQPRTRAPTGMADQASTPATLMTRPSRWWLGTICRRRLPVPVLVLRKMSRPEMADHNPRRRPVPAGRGQHDRQQPATSRAPRAAANPMRSRPAGRTGFGCPRQAMQLPTPADRRTTSSRPGAPTSPRPLLRNLGCHSTSLPARPWIAAELTRAPLGAGSQAAT
jgi:hypothetical protein